MRAFAIATPTLTGIGRDQYFPILPNMVGSGRMPDIPFRFCGTDLAVDTGDRSAYAVLGATMQPRDDGDRDYVSAKVIGKDARTLIFMPGDRFVFDPNIDRLHLHFMCAERQEMIVYLTVFWLPLGWGL